MSNLVGKRNMSALDSHYYTIDDLISYCGVLTVDDEHTDKYKDCFSVDYTELKTNIEFNCHTFLAMIKSYTGESDSFKAVRKIASDDKKFSWLVRDLAIIAYINKHLRLGNPVLEVRKSKGTIIPSVILLGKPENIFITGYIIHHGISYEMQSYLNSKGVQSYAPKGKPYTGDEEIARLVQLLNYQYVLYY